MEMPWGDSVLEVPIPTGWRRRIVRARLELPWLSISGVGCLLVLEDLHWADPETLALLHYIAPNLRDESLLVVATSRPFGRRWLVHFEGDGKDKAGKPLTYVIDGKIENLGLPHRSITGTWKAGTETGPFKISRQ